MTSKKIISADSHVIEPPNLWLDYIEPEFKSRAPHCERENDKDVFKCDGGVSLIQVGAVSAAGRPVDEVSNLGNYESDAPKGAYDSSARVGEIATDGVEAEVLYPSIALRMFAIADVPYQLACFRAYNSWMADFVKPYPDTFKGIGLVPIDDIEAAVGELHRCKEIGLAGVSVAVSTRPRDDLRQAALRPAMGPPAEAAGMPISLHILTERRRAAQTTDSVARLANGATECFAIQDALARMIFGGVFHRYPGLRIVSAENDIGWAAYFTERIDYLLRPPPPLPHLRHPQGHPPQRVHEAQRLPHLHARPLRHPVAGHHRRRQPDVVHRLPPSRQHLAQVSPDDRPARRRHSRRRGPQDHRRQRRPALRLQLARRGRPLGDER